MNRNIKSIIAAVLCAACLAGCSSNDSSGSSYSYAPQSVNSQESSSSTESSSAVSSPKSSSSSSAVSSSKPVQSSSESSSSSSSSSSSRHLDLHYSGDRHCTPDDPSYRHKFQLVPTVIATKDTPGRMQKKVCTVCGKEEEFTYDFYYNYYDETETFISLESAQQDLWAHQIIEELDLDNENKTDLEKLLLLRKWFVDNIVYDITHDTYGVLKSHKANCTGCAYTAEYILDKCGVEIGLCTDGDDHMFNVVKINGKWTYTDFVTRAAGQPKSNILVLGTSFHGPGNGSRFDNEGNSLDRSEVSTELHVYALDGTELKANLTDDGFTYVDKNGQGWKCVF